jgi:hypothetical protein
MPGLSKSEIAKVVNRYVGVDSGYLGDFSYRTHADFYPEYCDLDIDPYLYEGTTRQRFIEIISSQEPYDQAKILRGVLERFPVGEGPATRTQDLREQIVHIAQRLEGASPVTNPTPQISSELVSRALADAETLIQSNGATSGVDRIHTALHGYFHAACDNENIPFPQDANLTKLFKLMRQHHPKLQDLGPRAQDIEQVLRATSAILDALNPVRNKASVAHPNSDLLGQNEAMLIINATRTMLHYFDSKLS